MYQGEDYDLAGFASALSRKIRIIDGSQVKPGDAIIGIAASGPHANGFSLIRKILQVSGAQLTTSIGNYTLGEALLRPTRIYVKPLLELLKHINVHAMAHITGGGLLENIPRVLPDYTRARLHPAQWTTPPIFQWLQEKGQVQDQEMYRTFNCGIGMIVCVDESAVAQSLAILQQAGETAWGIGHIESSSQQQPQVII